MPYNTKEAQLMQESKSDEMSDLKVSIHLISEMLDELHKTKPEIHHKLKFATKLQSAIEQKDEQIKILKTWYMTWNNTANKAIL